MGTRSLTRIIPRQEGLSYSDGHTRGELALVNAYQQYGGYPEYMAVEYAEWLQGLSVGNGIAGENKLHWFYVDSVPIPLFSLYILLVRHPFFSTIVSILNYRCL